MLEFEIKKDIATLSNTANTEKKLALVSWDNKKPKLEVRTWRYDDEETKAGKGITLDRAEAEALAEALTSYLQEQPIKGNPLQAIRNKCLDCTCNQPKEITSCESQTCPLFAFRELEYSLQS